MINCDRNKQSVLYVSIILCWCSDWISCSLADKTLLWLMCIKHLWRILADHSIPFLRKIRSIWITTELSSLTPHICSDVRLKEGSIYVWTWDLVAVVRIGVVIAQKKKNHWSFVKLCWAAHILGKPASISSAVCTSSECYCRSSYACGCRNTEILSTWQYKVNDGF